MHKRMNLVFSSEELKEMGAKVSGAESFESNRRKKRGWMSVPEDGVMSEDDDNGFFAQGSQEFRDLSGSLDSMVDRAFDSLGDFTPNLPALSGRAMQALEDISIAVRENRTNDKTRLQEHEEDYIIPITVEAEDKTEQFKTQEEAQSSEETNNVEASPALEEYGEKEAGQALEEEEARFEETMSSSQAEIESAESREISDPEVIGLDDEKTLPDEYMNVFKAFSSPVDVSEESGEITTESPLPPVPAEAEEDRKIPPPPVPVEAEEDRKIPPPPVPVEAEEGNNAGRPPAVPVEAEEDRKIPPPPVPAEGEENRKIPPPPVPAEAEEGNNAGRPPAVPVEAEEGKNAGRPPAVPAEAEENRKIPPPPVPAEAEEGNNSGRLPAIPDEAKEGNNVVRPPPVPSGEHGEKSSDSSEVVSLHEESPQPAVEMDEQDGGIPVPIPDLKEADVERSGDSATLKLGEKKKTRKKKRPWFEDFFNDDYLLTLPFETPTVTVAEAEFIEAQLGLPVESRLLDLACGYGRHAVELAKKGYNLVGLDNSLPMLLKAAEMGEQHGVEVNFMHGDMKEMAFEGGFQGVYCFNTSFGYFEDDMNKKVLGKVFKALDSGGRFLLQVVNRDFLLTDLPLRVWWEGEGCVVMEEVEFNYFTSRVESKRSVVFNDGRQINRNLSVRVYSLHELGKLLHQAGFVVRAVTGNLATPGRFFGPHSPFLIIKSEKK